jgi:hypothetical protein
MTSRQLFFDIAIEQCVERYVRQAGVCGLLVQLNQEAFEMLAKGLSSLVNRGVEGLSLQAPLSAFTDVVTELPGKSLGAPSVEWNRADTVQTFSLAPESLHI